MKELFSKFTFGFLMAQVFPGAISVISISLTINSYGETEGFQDLYECTMDFWLSSGSQIGVLIILSVAAGMLFHGINWSVLGYLENYFDRNEEGNLISHNENVIKFYSLKLEIIYGPWIICKNIFMFIFMGKDINQVTLEENVPKIHKNKMDAFHFIQEFYLYFSQFYLHTSYSLVISLLCAPIVAYSLKIDWALAIVCFLLIYLVCGLFFLIGRIQFSSMFRAESQLVKISETMPISDQPKDE